MNQLKTGAALSYVIILANIIIGVLYTPFMLRALGQSEYGLYSLAASIVAYLTLFDLGFANSIIRYTAKFRAEGKLQEQYEMFGMFLKLYNGIGIVALLAGLCLTMHVESLFGATMTGGELSIMRVMMLLMTFNIAFTFPFSIYGAIITAYENFVFQKIINLFRVILNPLVMVLLLCLGYKAITMVVVITVFNIVTLLANCWYCYKRLHIKIKFGKFDFPLFKELSIYSSWIFLNAVMDRLYWSSGQFILGIYAGTAAVAIYALAIQLKTMYFMFSTAISGLFLPKVTAMITNRASDKVISDLFIRMGRLQFIVIAYIISGFIFLGKPFINLWAGHGYEDVYMIVLILFAATLIPLIQNLGITILQARNEMKFRSIVYIVLSVGSVVLSIPLAKHYGALGCAVATAIALLLGQGLVINIYYAKKIKLNILKFWKEIFKMSIIPTLVVCIGMFCSSYVIISTVGDFVLASLSFSLVYATLFCLFSMNQYERNLLGKPFIILYRKFI